MFIPSNCSSIDEVEFAFDLEVINTATYRRAFASKLASKSHAIEAQSPPTSLAEHVKEVQLSATLREADDTVDILGLMASDRKASEASSTTLINPPLNGVENQELYSKEKATTETILQPVSGLSYGILARKMTIRRKPVLNSQVTGHESEDTDLAKPNSKTASLYQDLEKSTSSTLFSQYMFGKTLQEQWRRNALQQVISVDKVNSEEKVRFLVQFQNAAKLTHTLQLCIRVIKRIDPQIQPLIAKAQKEDVYWETGVLRKLAHPNIACIHEFLEDEKVFGICMIYNSDKTLNHFITNVSDVSSPERNKLVYSLFKQLSSAVLYLHCNGTVHCDLTLENIVYCEDEAKIIVTNFSTSKTVDLKKKCRPSSAEEGKSSSRVRFAASDMPFTECSYRDQFFAAPELLKRTSSPRSRRKGSQLVDVEEMTLEAGKIDVYSCGVILVSACYSSKVQS
jgi:serine/threonine protein kinase